MEFIIATLDVLKLESRALRKGIASLWLELILIAVAGVLLIVGSGLLVTGVFLVIRLAVGTAGAALITGLMVLLLAGGLLWYVRNPRP